MLVLVALAVLIGAAVAVLPALAAAPSEAKLEVNENCVDPGWPCWATPGSGANPAPASKVTIALGGKVKFIDHGKEANINWTSTPSGQPTCPEVPVSPMSAKTGWEGTCEFNQPGTYKFESSTLFIGDGLNYTMYEIVVEGAATGTTPTTPTTTTPTTTTPTTPMMPGEPSQGSPLEGGPKALKLAGSQHGSSVRGSVKISQQTRVGRLVRSSLKAGSVSFSVPLNAKGKAALRRHRRLALTVKVTLTPVHGAAVTVTRNVVVYA